MKTVSRVNYVRILIHRDVLEDARLAIRLLEDGQPADEGILRNLKDLADPLPEPDIYGHEPYIEDVFLPSAGE